MVPKWKLISSCARSVKVRGIYSSLILIKRIAFCEWIYIYWVISLRAEVFVWCDKSCGEHKFYTFQVKLTIFYLGLLWFNLNIWHATAIYSYIYPIGEVKNQEWRCILWNWRLVIVLKRLLMTNTVFCNSKIYNSK